MIRLEPGLTTDLVVSIPPVPDHCRQPVVAWTGAQPWAGNLAFEDAELMTESEDLGAELGLGAAADDQDVELGLTAHARGASRGGVTGPIHRAGSAPGSDDVRTAEGMPSGSYMAGGWMSKASARRTNMENSAAS